MKGLSERQKESKEKTLNRNRISRESRQKLFEKIEKEEYKEAFSLLFEVLTGKNIDKYSIVRDCKGNIITPDDEYNYSFKIDIVGPEEFSEEVYGDEYYLNEISEGKYSIDAKLSSVYSYDEDYLERIEYSIKDAEVVLSSDNFIVNSDEVKMHQEVDLPDIVLETVAVGNEK